MRYHLIFKKANIAFLSKHQWKFSNFIKNFRSNNQLLHYIFTIQNELIQSTLSFLTKVKNLINEKFYFFYYAINESIQSSSFLIFFLLYQSLHKYTIPVVLYILCTCECELIVIVKVWWDSITDFKLIFR